jgi:ABC-type dipeptide/oligopeptide/nickel transport system ATPase subunit
MVRGQKAGRERWSIRFQAHQWAVKVTEQVELQAEMNFRKTNQVAGGQEMGEKRHRSQL